MFVVDEHMLKRDIVLREWDEIWSHSRHLATMRMQYLGFYFTALLAVAAIAGNQAVESSLRTNGSLVAVSFLGASFSVLSAYLYLAVERLNSVNSHYDELIFDFGRRVRDEFGASFELPEFPAPPRSFGRPGWNYHHYPDSGGAEKLLFASVLVTPIALTLVSWRAFDTSTSEIVQLACMAAAFASVGVGIYARWSLRKPNLAPV